MADVSAGDAYVASCHAVMEPQDTGGGSGGSVGGGSRDVFAGSSHRPRAPSSAASASQGPG